MDKTRELSLAGGISSEINSDIKSSHVHHPLKMLQISLLMGPRTESSGWPLYRFLLVDRSCTVLLTASLTRTSRLLTRQRSLLVGLIFLHSMGPLIGRQFLHRSGTILTTFLET